MTLLILRLQSQRSRVKLFEHRKHIRLVPCENVYPFHYFLIFFFFVEEGVGAPVF